MWDIREATLKRYGAIVGKRPEYNLRLTEKEKKIQEDQAAPRPLTRRNNMENILPPLPSAPPVDSTVASANNLEPRPQLGELVIPPLPPEVPPLPGAMPMNRDGETERQRDEEENNNIVPGQFVANDLADEGVKLLSKFQHGSNSNENQQGPGTRSRRGAVNVICVARCPLGGHFATGSDDGICRVWEDQDDNGVATVDIRFFGESNAGVANARCTNRSRARGSQIGKFSTGVSKIVDFSF